ncbi:MAG: DNA methyltransferase [Curvibacter sp.]
MTPQEFVAKWGAPGGHPGPAYHLNEEQGAQSHFLDLCELLGVPKPGSSEGYLFEEKSQLIGGRTGYADVFMRGVFAWENKAPGKNLDSALRQLLTYSLALSNPPLLVVSDRLTIRIHTQFTGHPSQTHEVRLEELDQPDKLALLRRIWTAPESFKPKVTNRDITEAAAKSFATLAEQLRQRGHDAEQVAHFLTQCLFCFFAEDVSLLPGRMFERLVNNRHITADKLTTGLADLFKVMRDGGLYGPDDIPWFNGGLFRKISVPKLEILDVTELRNAAGLNWSAIDVSIFGTLFERGLDPAKRSQLGAHYTDPATIMRLVDPVIRRPLLAQWDQTAKDIQALMAKSARRNDKHHKAAQAKFITWLELLKDYRVLDPACGSGNFLFLGLKTLKDIEHHSHLQAAALGLDRQADLVTGPHNVLGIELNEYAAELARVTVWIGELQWRIEHGFAFKTNPVLEPLDNIECRDALLTTDPVRAAPVEAAWPKASVVIGNPPFLGGSKKRGELGDAYYEALNTVYAGRVPGGADLVCYWFDKALKAIETTGLDAAGLVATNSIRGGANRKVLQTITKHSHIFAAWSDEPWVNDGAAVRVSLVCFGHGDGMELNGTPVPQIYADLTAPAAAGDMLDVSQAHTLPDTLGASFQGASKKSKFEIDAQLARDWLRQPNPHGHPNSDVLKPWANGFELTRGPQHPWISDFGK